MKPITIVGSYNVGLFLKGERLPHVGETVIADTFHEGGGGKGSNQAVAASIFGAQVRFVAKIGDDGYGRNCLEMYDRFDVDSSLISVNPENHTGVSVILIDKNGDNLISVAPGANLDLSADDLDAHRRVFSESAVVGFQLENRIETVIHGIRLVHALGVPVFLDPAPAVPLPEDIFPLVKIIKPNETEAEILTGVAVSDVDSAIEAGSTLTGWGCEHAIVTLGERGAVHVDTSGYCHYPPPAVHAVDSTGAGDIFSGAFLAGLAAGQSMDQAIRFAVAAASRSTEKLGVIESIPSSDDVSALLERNGAK